MSHVSTSAEVARDESAVEGSPDMTPGRRGFIKTTLLSQPQAIVGLVVVLAIILMAVFAPLIATYSIHEKTGPIYAPPSLDLRMVLPEPSMKSPAPR